MEIRDMQPLISIMKATETSNNNMLLKAIKDMVRFHPIKTSIHVTILGDQHRQPEGQVIEQPHQIVAQQEVSEENEGN